MKTTRLAVTAITVLSAWVAADEICATSANEVCSIKFDPASGPTRRCGRYAKLRRPSLLSTCSTASNVIDCGAICYDNPSCKSFSFDQAASSCNFYDKSLPRQGVRDLDESSGLGSNTYSRRCYTRSWVDRDYQLVQNPGFEVIDVSIPSKSQSWSWDVLEGSPGHGVEHFSLDGSKSYYVTKEAFVTSTQAASLSQPLSLPSGCALAKGAFSLTMDIGQYTGSDSDALATAASPWSLSLVLDDVVFEEITQICSADEPCTFGPVNDVVWRSITVSGNYIGNGNPSPKFEIRAKAMPDDTNYWVVYLDNALLTIHGE